MARRFGVTSQISTYPAMVLGSSETRLIDMTRAFAAVSAKGNAVEPYGIVKVTSASGDLLYRHQKKRETALVPDYVAGDMTQLLVAAVSTGTGKEAQIGRPVAGKTGTTSSNKDGLFIGFSSGITTGVWMGRDDSKTVAGLQGGRAPARAFAAFMRYAVRGRPVEEFDFGPDRPEWQEEPEEREPYGDPDDYYFYDEDGNLIEPGQRDPGLIDRLDDGTPRPPRNDAPPAVSEDFLEEAIGGGSRNNDRPAPPPRRDPPPTIPRQPAPGAGTGPNDPER
jgi:penicillin-binding protein 1A